MKIFLFACLALGGCYKDYPRLHDVPRPLVPALTPGDVSAHKTVLRSQNTLSQIKAQDLEKDVRTSQ